jgi:hypothetical protein
VFEDPETTALCKKLLLLPVIALAVLAAMFLLTMSGAINVFMVTYAVFTCGVIGGFVSIQQRMNKMRRPEIAALSASWFRVLLMPLYGGIFALVFYALCFSGIITGSLFPSIYVPEVSDVPDVDYLRRLFEGTYPATGEDFAKLMFWSFVAGFCERFVPQVVRSIAHDATPPEGTADAGASSD